MTSQNLIIGERELIGFREDFSLATRHGKAWSLDGSLYQPMDYNSDTPMVIIVPGFRGQGRDSEQITRLRDEILQQGLAVAVFDYSGMENDSIFADPADFNSNVDDVHAVLNHFKNPDHILVSVSSGVNAAFKAANENTKGIVSVIPAPDLYQEMIKPRISNMPRIKQFAFHTMLALGLSYKWINRAGYGIKLTARFLNSSNQNPLEKVLGETQLSNTSPVILVQNMRDGAIPKTVITKMINCLKAFNFSVKKEIANPVGHLIHPETAVKTANAIADLALRRY